MSDDEPHVVDKVNIGTGLRLIDRSKPAPMATCPRDDEPLIASFEQRGAEFVCIVCGTWYGFLSPKPADPTPELNARYSELRGLYAAGVRRGACAHMSG